MHSSIRSDIHIWASAPPLRFPGPWKETCWSFNIQGFIGYLNEGHGMSFFEAWFFGQDVRSVRWVCMVEGHNIFIAFAG